MFHVSCIEHHDALKEETAFDISVYTLDLYVGIDLTHRYGPLAESKLPA